MFSFEAEAQVCNYGIYSAQETNIRDRVVVSKGLVGSATKIEIGVEASVKSSLVSSGNVFLRDRSFVDASVFAAGNITKQNQVTVTGEELSGLSINPETIPVKTVPTGSEHITLYSGNHRVLTPGNYGDVHLHSGSSLRFSTKGVYNFRKLIMETGETKLLFSPGTGFIEINAKNELRFGDRNQFVIEDNADPVQVQFYTGATSRVKIGTDSVFNGVVTAPNAQIYVYSRVEVNGALYGKQVWVDTDSKVNLYPNCTEYNTEFEDEPYKDMCDTLGFEDNYWVPVAGGGTSEVSLVSTGFFEETALMISLNEDPYVDLETQIDISMPFSEGATQVHAAIDVRSNASPYDVWGAEIALFLKDAQEGTYEYAGFAAYDAEEPEGDTYTTLILQLVPKYSAALLAGRKVSALLSVSAEQNYALFYLDNLRFCDNEGMCNYTCPKVYPEGFIPGEEVDDFVQIQINNEGDFIVPDQEELTGTVKNTEDYTISISIEARMIPPQGDTEIIELGTVTLQAGETHSFSLLATQISDPVPGALNQLFFRVNQISPLPNIFSDSYLWYYEKTGNKAVLYSKEAFKEQKEKILYENPQPETPSPYKLYDQDGNEVGYYIKIQRDAEIEIDSDEPEPDTYTEDDSDYIIVV